MRGPGRRTIVAIAAAAGIAERFRRACWFFSHAAWDIDDLGLAAARLIVGPPPGPAPPVLVDAQVRHRGGSLR